MEKRILHKKRGPTIFENSRLGLNAYVKHVTPGWAVFVTTGII